MFFFTSYLDDDDDDMRPLEPGPSWEELQRTAISLKEFRRLYLSHPDDDHISGSLSADEMHLSSTGLRSPHIQSGAVTPADDESPPQLGEFLLRPLVATRDLDVFAGDLAERYRNNLRKVGVKKAKRQYYTDLLTLMLLALMRIAIKLGLLEWIRRKLGL